MKRDPLKATVLATRYIPNATQKMVQDLITAGGIIEYDPQRHRSLALLTADCDDVTYTALDEATKKADVDVIYAHSFYAEQQMQTPSSQVRSLVFWQDRTRQRQEPALEAAVDFIENEAHFVSANDDDSIPYYAHCISRTGSYLSSTNGIKEGEALAYLIAPPLEAMYALDAAIKAADVTIVALYNPPSETNFGGGLLTGSQSACKAACNAFAEAVEAVAANPLV